MHSSTRAPSTSTTSSAPSPAGAPGSDPTTTPCAPTSSPPRSASTSSGSSTSPQPAIRFADRIFITGTTGSGKSELSRALFLSAPGPRLVIDPNDSDLTMIPGAVTFTDPARSTNRRGENWREAATARFVPNDPEDRDEYDAVYRWAFYNGPRRVWCDEAGFVHPAQGSAPHPRKFQTQGRKRQLGLQACHTRPREIDTNLVAQADHLLVFQTPVRRDRDYIAENAGIETARFEAAHAALVEYGFFWLDRRRRTLTVMEPLQL